MTCPSCQHESALGAKFCEQCGAPLERQCRQCSTQLAPGAKFCAECGTAVGNRSPASSERSPEPPADVAAALEGERKTITVLFADLKGSTALIDGLDPEAARAILDPALRIMMEAVHQFEGFVAQVMGDGIFALFGAPLAYEDHPQRALHAALQMQAEMRQYASHRHDLKGQNLALRVGINTGEVLVRAIQKDAAHTDYVPVGHTTHLAARLEQLAPPGSILISEETCRHCADFFEMNPLPPMAIKGVSEPLLLYEVLGIGHIQTRFQRTMERGLAHFTGRQTELSFLERACTLSRDGQGQIVGIMGEAGLGKSRLVHEFKRTLPHDVLLLEAFGVAHAGAVPWWPVAGALKTYFQFEVSDGDDVRRDKVLQKLEALDPELAANLPYLLSVLGIVSDSTALAQLGEQLRRRRMLEAVQRLLLLEAERQPVVLLFEDLHWVDTESNTLLTLLAENLDTTRVLLVTNYRPEYLPSWQARANFVPIRLAPLNAQDASALLDTLLGAPVANSTQSLDAVKRFVLDKTQGTPFFLEEVVQALFEQGVLVRESPGMVRVTITPLAVSQLAFQIPTTVQGVLSARIDRLPPAQKQILQTLAVLGREFDLSLAAQVIAEKEDALAASIAELQRKEFLQTQGPHRQAAYRFKHALTQDVAYQSLTLARRQRLHESAARAIEAHYAAQLETHYPELAHHYKMSGNVLQAVHYLHLAGTHAARRSAATEAVAYLETACDLVLELKASEQRDRLELVLKTDLGKFLMVATSIAAEAVAAAYERAYELCKVIGTDDELFPIVVGLRASASMRGHLVEQRYYADEIMALSHRRPDTTVSLNAYTALGLCHMPAGNCVAAWRAFERALQFYDFDTHRTQVADLGHDPGILARGFGSHCVWMAGHPDTAVIWAQGALALAAQNGFQYSIGLAHLLHSWLRALMRDETTAVQAAAAGISFGEQYGFVEWVAFGTLLLNRYRADGEESVRLARIKHIIKMFRVNGNSLYLPIAVSYQGELEMSLGLIDDSLATFTEAIALAEESEETWALAELNRLLGQALLIAEPTNIERAEMKLTHALEISRTQNAKAWELRTATDLARLWHTQGRTREAVELLTPVYGWFTEGFDTKDLLDGKALLDELSSVCFKAN